MDTHPQIMQSLWGSDAQSIRSLDLLTLNPYPAHPSIPESLKMDHVRWLLALPEPGYDASTKTQGELRVDAYLRKRESPLWGLIHWCLDLPSSTPRALRRLRNSVWACEFTVFFFSVSLRLCVEQGLWVAGSISNGTVTAGRRRP